MRKVNKDLASIIIVNYNNAQYLSKSINSVLKQKYKYKEIIVVDDKSNDNSLKILKKFEGKIKLIKNKRKTKIGSYNQINSYYLGFLKSKGKIIFFLDSDDFFSNKKIYEVMNFFKKKKETNLLFDLPIIINHKKLIKKKFSQKYFLLSSWPRFSPQSCISIKRNFAKEIFRVVKIKKFNSIWFDFRLAIYSYLKFNNIIILKKYLTYYRKSENSVSNKYQTFTKNWWIRRSEAHDYFTFATKKLKVKDRITLDKIVTKIMNLAIN
tara:strand:+ start:248 stop:1045 length:798 start_codon:yes stop_codon:yes gene_type:complete